jgi:hypothetical protein
VAAQLGWAESTVTRKETGSIGVKVVDLDRLLDLYGVDPAERARLRDLARRGGRARTGPRGTRGARGLYDVYERYVELEETAIEISTYAAAVVPGLLQTPEYADAIFAATPMPEENLVRPRMAVRLERQVTALTRTPPPQLRVILDEAVLLRPVGGPEVMRSQALRLLEMFERSHISLRVMPIAVGAHPAVTGQFSILYFGERSQPTVVFCDGLTGGSLRDESDAVERYRACFNALDELACGEDESLALLKTTAERFRA